MAEDEHLVSIVQKSQELDKRRAKLEKRLFAMQGFQFYYRLKREKNSLKAYIPQDKARAAGLKEGSKVIITIVSAEGSES